MTKDLVEVLELAVVAEHYRMFKNYKLAAQHYRALIDRAAHLVINAAAAEHQCNQDAEDLAKAEGKAINAKALAEMPR